MVKFFKRVVILCGRRTSVRMSEVEWQTLESISRFLNIRRNRLIELIKNHKAKNLGLTPAIRLFMIMYFNAMQKSLINKKDMVNLFDLLCSLR